MNIQKQSVHIENHKNYIKGRSIVFLNFDEIQDIINKYAGTGKILSTNKEAIDCGKTIGLYINYLDKSTEYTTRFTIRYSKTGSHIVPASAKGDYYGKKHE